MKVQSTIFGTALVLGVAAARDGEQHDRKRREVPKGRVSENPTRKFEQSVVSTGNQFDQPTRDLRIAPRSRAIPEEAAAPLKKGKKGTASTTASTSPQREKKAPQKSHEMQSGDMKAKAGKQVKGKSGKGTEPMLENYYISPFSCTNQCIDSAKAIDHDKRFLNEAVVYCENESPTQLWTVHQEDTFVKVESDAHPGHCISISYMEGDTHDRIDESCSNSYLTLDSCEHDAASWYFTGGQLLSSFCWMHGRSTNMGVFYDSNAMQCDSYVEAYAASAGAFFREDTFMFFNSDVVFPDPPQRPLPYPTAEPTMYTDWPTYSDSPTEPTAAPTESSTL